MNSYLYLIILGKKYYNAHQISYTVYILFTRYVLNSIKLLEKYKCCFKEVNTHTNLSVNYYKVKNLFS